MTQSPSSSCGTARVATVPRSGVSRASGHVPTAPRGISVTGSGGTSGISEDADNLLILGSDLKPFISCLIIDECLDGRFEPLGAVEDAFTDHLSADNPHTQYLLAANYNIADALDFTDTTGVGADGYSVQWDNDTGKFVLAEVIGITDHGDLTGLEDNDHPQYLLATAYTAADVLAKLLTVDIDASGLNATTLQGYTPASFDSAGAAAAAISAHLLAADPHSQYLFDSQVSAYGLTLIDDANAAVARTTLELGTMALETASNYLLASGATVGASASVQTLTLGAKLPKIQPLSDSTNAFGLYAANGSTQHGWYDSTNGRFGWRMLPTVNFEVAAPNATNGTEIARFTGGSGGHSTIVRNVASGDLGGGFLGTPALASTNGYIALAAEIILTSGKTLTINQTTYANGQISVGGSTSQTGYIIRVGADATFQGPFILRDGLNAETFRVMPSGRIGTIGITAPTAIVDVAASTTARASLRLRTGVAPTSPNDGDIWLTTAGLFVRVNGVTVGPLS